jgi:hypothetical protein
VHVEMRGRRGDARQVQRCLSLVPHMTPVHLLTDRSGGIPL